MSAQHDAAQQQFTLNRQEYTGTLAYELPTAQVIDFTHTFVDEALRGQGVGEELARTGLGYARTHQLRVRASCPFVADFLEKNAGEYADLARA